MAIDFAPPARRALRCEAILSPESYKAVLVTDPTGDSVLLLNARLLPSAADRTRVRIWAESVRDTGLRLAVYDG